MEKQELCYWCGKPATSREHMPPKCLFPEGKDLEGVDRKDSEAGDGRGQWRKARKTA